MAGADYLCCKRCQDRVFYDGNRELREWLSEKWSNLKDPGIFCPQCVKALEKQDQRRRK